MKEKKREEEEVLSFWKDYQVMNNHLKNWRMEIFFVRRLETPIRGKDLITGNAFALN